MQKDISILLVDDSIAMRHTIKNMLNDLGYANIHTASNGVDALNKIRNSIAAGQVYPLIFLDWNMPEMDGLTLLKICRGELGLKDVAIVMLTAVSDQKSVVEAMNSGVTSYITKPVSTDIIAKKLVQVDAWMNNQRKCS